MSRISIIYCKNISMLKSLMHCQKWKMSIEICKPWIVQICHESLHKCSVTWINKSYTYCQWGKIPLMHLRDITFTYHFPLFLHTLPTLSYTTDSKICCSRISAINQQLCVQLGTSLSAPRINTLLLSIEGSNKRYLRNVTASLMFIVRCPISIIFTIYLFIFCWQ